MADLEEMLDHYRISKLVAQYCHGCDRAQEQLIASAYAENGTDAHGLYQGTGKAFAETVIRERQSRGHTMSHQLGQTLIDLQGDRAGAETYFIAVIRSRRKNGSDWLDQLGGRYVDKLERLDGCWKIEARVVVRDWSISLPIRNDDLAGVGFAAGRSDLDDPGAAILRGLHARFDGRR